MPLTLTISQGALPVGTEKQAFAALCDAMLKWHGLEGNSVMTPNVVGSIHIIPKEYTFSGLKEASVAFVEWKVPSFAFSNREIQQGYIADATNIIHEMSGKQLSKSNIWVNVVHAVDGAWGIGGQAMTNTQLGEAISHG